MAVFDPSGILKDGPLKRMVDHMTAHSIWKPQNHLAVCRHSQMSEDENATAHKMMLKLEQESNTLIQQIQDQSMSAAARAELRSLLDRHQHADVKVESKDDLHNMFIGIKRRNEKLNVSLIVCHKHAIHAWYLWDSEPTVRSMQAQAVRDPQNRATLGCGDLAHGLLQILCALPVPSITNDALIAMFRDKICPVWVVDLDQCWECHCPPPKRAEAKQDDHSDHGNGYESDHGNDHESDHRNDHESDRDDASEDEDQGEFGAEWVPTEKKTSQSGAASNSVKESAPRPIDAAQGASGTILQGASGTILQGPNETPKSSSMDTKICSNSTCGKSTNLAQCGRCRQVQYCSSECQKLHWKAGHKKNCLAPEQALVQKAMEATDLSSTESKQKSTTVPVTANHAKSERNRELKAKMEASKKKRQEKNQEKATLTQKGAISKASAYKEQMSDVQQSIMNIFKSAGTDAEKGDALRAQTHELSRSINKMASASQKAQIKNALPALPPQMQKMLDAPPPQPPKLSRRERRKQDEAKKKGTSPAGGGGGGAEAESNTEVAARLVEPDDT